MVLKNAESLFDILNNDMSNRYTKTEISSLLTWKNLMSPVNLSENLEKTLSVSLANVNEVLFYIQTSSKNRQSWVFRGLDISNNLMILDIMFGGYRMYCQITFVSNTKIKFTNVAPTTGTISWNNVGLGILYR